MALRQMDLWAAPAQPAADPRRAYGPWSFSAAEIDQVVALHVLDQYG